MKSEWRYSDDDIEVVVRFKTTAPDRRLLGISEAVRRVQRWRRITLAWAHGEAGMTYRDIAAALGITRQAARQQCLDLGPTGEHQPRLF